MKKREWLAGMWIVAGLLAAPIAMADESDKCKLTGDAATCGQCGMATSGEEARRFGAYTRGGMPEWSFDDIGCMLLWRDSKCMPTQVELDGNLYVRDFMTGEEITATKASYVIHSGVKTPMGYGIIVFGDVAGARGFSEEHPGSAVMPYEQLTAGDLKTILAR